MSKRIEAVVEWNKVGEAAGAREVRFTLEVPVSHTTSREEDALLALWDPRGYDGQMVRVDAGKYPAAPTSEEITQILQAVPAQWAAKAAQEKVEKEQRAAVELARDRECVLQELSEPESAKRVYADGRPTCWALDPERVPGDLRSQVTALLEACQELKQAEMKAEMKVAEEKTAREAEKLENRRKYIRTWAEDHGSERLRLQLEAGLDGWPLYLRERLASDLGEDAQLDNDGDDLHPPANPTLEQLKVAKDLASRLVECGQISQELADESLSQVEIMPMKFEEDDRGNDSFTAVYARASWRPGPPEIFHEYDVRVLCPREED